MPKETQNSEELLEALPETIAALFQGAQTSNATHKRRVNTLCKLFIEATKVTKTQVSQREGVQGSVQVLTGEKAFNRAFWSILRHVLNVKRGIVAADRVLRFVGAFIGALMISEDITNEEYNEDQTPRDRFLQRLVARIIIGCTAKDKTPRFRCTQLLSELLRQIPSLEDETYNKIKSSLLERCTDREWTIRAISCIGLGVLARVEASEDQSAIKSLEDRQVITVLEELCQHDVHNQVRVAALPGMALPLNPTSLVILLSRCRDIDASVRKMAFRLLSQIQARALSVSQRSTAVRNGLGDRDPQVRAEATKLIYRWAIGCSAVDQFHPDTSKSAKTRVQASAKVDLDEFLDLFDLWDGEVAEEALRALIYKRPDLMDEVNLNHPDYWSAFSPSKAILARVFTEIVAATTQQSDSSREMGLSSILSVDSGFSNRTRGAIFSVLETSQGVPFDGLKYTDSLPTLTLQAFNIQGLFNLLVQTVNILNSQQLHSLPSVPGVAREDLEEQLEDCVFSLNNLLKMTTVLLDTLGADEMGRRKVKTLIEDMITQPCLPESHLQEAITLQLKLSDDTTQFVKSTIEPILQEVLEEKYQPIGIGSRTYFRRDSIEGLTKTVDKSDAQLNQGANKGTDNEKAMVTYRQLCVTNISLEIIEWTPTESNTLHLLQRYLIKPALAVYVAYPRAAEDLKHQIFDAALKCLALIAISSRDLALNALGFCIRGAMGAIPSRHAERVLQCVFDIIMTHPSMGMLEFGELIKEAPSHIAGRPFLADVLIKSLQAEDQGVQATAAIGISKLMLCKIWLSKELLEALVLLYLLPDTSENHTLRQCLSYFFPSFCYSNRDNQKMFSEVITGAFIKLCSVYGELQPEAQDSSIDTQLLPQLDRAMSILLEYSDPTHLANGTKQEGRDEGIHLLLAGEILEKINILLGEGGKDDPAFCSVEPLCRALNRLRLPAEINTKILHQLLTTISGIMNGSKHGNKSISKQLALFQRKLRNLLDISDRSSENEMKLVRKTATGSPRHAP
ncbi:hypothetical protein FRC16_000632 [Serendipita sp. 398]|nr:hypothetical protein FRC16_000632 [Serendipita sp. 398]